MSETDLRVFCLAAMMKFAECDLIDSVDDVQPLASSLFDWLITSELSPA